MYCKTIPFGISILLTLSYVRVVESSQWAPIERDNVATLAGSQTTETETLPDNTIIKRLLPLESSLASGLAEVFPPIPHAASTDQIVTATSVRMENSSTVTTTITISGIATSMAGVTSMPEPTPEPTPAAVDTGTVAGVTPMPEPTSATTEAGSRTTVGAAAAQPSMGSSQMDQTNSDEQEHDPATGAFPGGFPQPLPDVPVTIVFLLLFMGGAFTHISIYRANAKRGHKFLISDLMFDFCMIRTLTCIFRIIWSFISPRGVILVALIFENGGAAVIFAVNLFFAKRIFRAMHPEIGWHPFFGIFTQFLILSVPSVIIVNIVSLSVSWFGVGKEAQLARTERALQFGASWNVMLSVMPLILLLAAGALPAKRKAENFGKGQLATKASLVGYASATLAAGAAVRAATILNPENPDTQDILFGKAVFYTTGFMLEIFVVALYAVARIDILFHIPDGSSKPGDYVAAQKVQATKGFSDMYYDIEEQLGLIGVEYQTISAPVVLDRHSEFVFAKLSINNGLPTLPPTPEDRVVDWDADDTAEVYIPPRPNRVSRRATMRQSILPNRPWRETLQGPYITGPLDPPAQVQEGYFPPEKY